jgi:predicted transcriptional regulator
MQNVRIVSTVEGYSFIIENKSIASFFKTGKSMTGSDVANRLGVSRMAVSQSLKRSLKKIFFILKKSNKHLDSFEIAVTISHLLRVSLDCENEMNKFFNLFPMDIKKEIKNHAKKYIRKYEIVC